MRQSTNGRQIASVVLGWPGNQDEHIECCVVATSLIKSMESLELNPNIPVGNPTGRISMFGKKNRERSPLRRRHNECQQFRLPVQHQQFSVVSLVQIDCRNSNEEPDEWKEDFDDDELVDPQEVELVLPHVLFRTEVHIVNWLAFFPYYLIDYDDDQWAAAKRGDLEVLETFVGINWTKTDEFESTPLYYACHSGAARDIRIVRYLLDQWPGEIPDDILSRCKKNAINASVVKILENPQDSVLHAEIEAVTSDDFIDGDDCFGSWNIFAEDSDY